VSKCQQCALNLLRAKRLWFTYEVPDRFVQNRTHSGYDSGYEAGWRGWEYSNPYTAHHWVTAYHHGYCDANTALHQEALKASKP